MSIVPNMGLNFMIFETCTHQFAKGSQFGLSTDISNGISGAISGGVSKFLTYPFDTIKKRIQQQVLYNTCTLPDDCSSRYRGVIDCAVKIWKQESIWGYYKVLMPSKGCLMGVGYCANCSQVYVIHCHHIRSL